MARLFAVAGGIIDAQDEAVATALGKAAGPVPELQSLSLGSLTPLAALNELALGGYSTVGPEDVSGAEFEQIKAGAEALQPEHFDTAATQLRATAAALESGANALSMRLNGVLGGDWQGEFAQNANYSVSKFVESATDLSGTLDKAAAKATAVHDGWGRTRTNIGHEAYTAETTAGPGIAEASAEQARHVVNTIYNPAVMDANLADLDFATAYRVVGADALSADGRIDPVSAWNTDGRIEPAIPAAHAAAEDAGTGGTAGTGVGTGTAGSGVAGAGGAAGAGTGTTSSSSPVDPTTQAALLDTTGREVAAGTAAGGTSAGTGGLNAATTAAAAPLMATGTTTGGQNGGQNGGGVIGRGTGTDRRRRDQPGFGSAAGALGAGAGAAALGAGAFGGAGTLAGHGGAGSGSGAAPGAAKGMPGAFASGGTTSAAAGPGGSTAAGAGQGMRGGMMPGAMMAAGAGQGRTERDGHHPASYLVNATNTTEIIGDPPKASPPILGRERRG